MASSILATGAAGTTVSLPAAIEAPTGEETLTRQRLEPGQVAESAGVGFEAAGETQLKNISVPVELFRARRSRID